jgi:hypothetical protein
LNFRRELQTLAHKHYFGFKRKNVHTPIFTQADHHILKDLAADSTVHITKPDKGRGLVIIDKVDYIVKVESILADSSKFVKIQDDPYKLSLKLEDKLNRFLRSLLKKKVLDEHSFQNMYSSGSSPGILYGLPKVHKPGTPVRPIVSSFSTHTYQMCKFLVDPLHDLACNC